MASLHHRVPGRPGRGRPAAARRGEPDLAPGAGRRPVRRTASPSRSSWVTSRTAPEWVSPRTSASRPDVGVAEELLEREQRGGGAPGQPGGPLQSRLALLGEVERQRGQQVVQPGVYGGGHLVIV